MDQTKKLPSCLCRILVFGVCLSVSACSFFDRRSNKEYVDSRSVAKLEIPPDLTQPSWSERMNVPGEETVRASARKQSAAPAAAGAAAGAGVAGAMQAGSDVIPDFQNISVGRDGNTRWLEVRVPADTIWPQLVDFWREQGIDLERNEPVLGVMQTEWVAERQSLPGFGIQGVLSSVTGVLAGSVGVRERFRTRVERRGDSTTDIYITSERAELTADSMDDDRTPEWGMVPPDQGADVEMLTRLMVFLGTNEERAHEAVATATGAGVSIGIVNEGETPVLVVDDKFDSVWRLTGVALDRAGLYVEQQDRAAGTYYFTYTEDLREKRSFWQKLTGDDAGLKMDELYEVRLTQSGDEVRITAHDSGDDAKPLEPEGAEKILERLMASYRVSS